MPSKSEIENETKEVVGKVMSREHTKKTREKNKRMKLEQGSTADREAEATRKVLENEREVIKKKRTQRQQARVR